MRDLYEGLVAENAEGELIPGAAANWTASENGLRYEIEIRANAKWSDGSPLTAADFVTSWRRVVDPANHSPVADVLRPIQNASEIISGKLPPTQLGVSARGSNFLIVDLRRPAPYFPQVLAHSAAYPSKSGLTRNGTNTFQLSNGPFKVVSWTPGGSIVLEKNLAYWNSGSVYFNQVRYIPFSDEDSEFRAYRAGNLDITSNIPINALPLINKTLRSELHVNPYLGTFYLGFNLRSGPLSQSRQLRKALTICIDRNTLQRSLLPFGQEAAFRFVPPGTWNYRGHDWAWRQQPREPLRTEARTIYASSGFSTNHPLELRLLINTNPALKRIALAIASMWYECLGVSAKITEEEYRVFLDTRKAPAKWDVLRLGWTADFNDASNFLNTFRSDSQNNDTGYSNTAFDRLMDQADNESDLHRRAELLEQAEQSMLSDYPVSPIYFYSSKRLARSSLRGVGANPLDRVYSRQLSRVSR